MLSQGSLNCRTTNPRRTTIDIAHRNLALVAIGVDQAPSLRGDGFQSRSRNSRALPAAISPPSRSVPPTRSTARARGRQRGTGPTHAGVSAMRQPSPREIARWHLPASAVPGSAPGVAVRAHSGTRAALRSRPARDRGLACPPPLSFRSARHWPRPAPVWIYDMARAAAGDCDVRCPRVAAGSEAVWDSDWVGIHGS